jgi:hypothetical protein
MLLGTQARATRVSGAGRKKRRSIESADGGHKPIRPLSLTSLRMLSGGYDGPRDCPGTLEMLGPSCTPRRDGVPVRRLACPQAGRSCASTDPADCDLFNARHDVDDTAAASPCPNVGRSTTPAGTEASGGDRASACRRCGYPAPARRRPTPARSSPTSPAPPPPHSAAQVLDASRSDAAPAGRRSTDPGSRACTFRNRGARAGGSRVGGGVLESRLAAGHPHSPRSGEAGSPDTPEHRGMQHIPP